MPAPRMMFMWHDVVQVGCLWACPSVRYNRQDRPGPLSHTKSGTECAISVIIMQTVSQNISGRYLAQASLIVRSDTCDTSCSMHKMCGYYSMLQAGCTWQDQTIKSVR